MNRRKLLSNLFLIPPIILSNCKKGLGITTPSIFKGTVIDDNVQPIDGFEFVFAGYTGGFSSKQLFSETATTNIKGEYYLEKLAPSNTVNFIFGPNTGSNLIYLLLKDCIYQNIPFR